MEAKKHFYYVIFIHKGLKLRNTQLIGKQSPYVILSIGRSAMDKTGTTVKEKAGCSCVWDEAIYIEIRNKVEFLLLEVKSGTDMIGLGRIAAAQVSEFPRLVDLQLTDQAGKKAGHLTLNVQKFNGTLSQLHAYAQELTDNRGHVSSSSVIPAANMFLKSINRGPIGSAGDAQQPVAYKQSAVCANAPLIVDTSGNALA